MSELVSWSARIKRGREQVDGESCGLYEGGRSVDESAWNRIILCLVEKCRAKCSAEKFIEAYIKTGERVIPAVGICGID